jgi:hypothetical protein
VIAEMFGHDAALGTMGLHYVRAMPSGLFRNLLKATAIKVPVCNGSVRVRMRVYRLNAVGRDGRVIVLATADTATKALLHLKAALTDHPRAWVTDERDQDVSIAELMRAAEHERNNSK